jgi:oxygen-independent coproporphyrinogen-3 oxidase
VNVSSLYVHFPWCVRRCPYCDFNSHPLRGPLPHNEYVQALIADLDAQLTQTRPARIGTVFFGGGTPSLFPPSAFAALLDRLASLLDDTAEITMEINPGTAEHHDLAGYARAGINRLSFGAQSFDDDRLRALGRIHDSAAIRGSFALARRAGFENINLDLMYGLPQQTPAAALADLDAALELEPEHVSWYQLTIEPRTELAKRPPTLPTDDSLAAMERDGYERLTRAGLDRYEVSAFARPGRRCRHNLAYWTFGDYFGVGAGAHGKISHHRPTRVIRTAKARQPRLYLADPRATLREAVTPRALPGEFLLNALRLTEGVPSERFQQATGLGIAALEPIRTEQIAAGLLTEGRLAATPRGYAVLNSVIAPYL